MQRGAWRVNSGRLSGCLIVNSHMTGIDPLQMTMLGNREARWNGWQVEVTGHKGTQWICIEMRKLLQKLHLKIFLQKKERKKKGKKRKKKERLSCYSEMEKAADRQWSANGHAWKTDFKQHLILKCCIAVTVHILTDSFRSSPHDVGNSCTQLQQSNHVHPKFTAAQNDGP